MSRARPLHLSMLLALAGSASGAPATTSPAVVTAPCTLPAGPIPTARRAVFVLDTSGSMRGIGDGQANIFGKVKEAVAQYVQAAQPDQVELITFDSGLKTTRSYALPSDAPRLQTDLNTLQADGRNTYLYRSLQAALTPLRGAQQYITSLFVLTDGIDNDRSRKETAESALNAFRERGPLDTLTYIALGTQIPADARAALQKSNYASGLTLPVGQVPALTRIGTGTLRVTQAQGVPVPFPDGTPVTLSAPRSDIVLASPTVQQGQVNLRLPARLPYGTPALLCAAPQGTPNVSGANVIGTGTQRLILDLNVGQDGSGITWLNPGADLTLSPGETAVLRYRAARDLPLDGLHLNLPAAAQGLTVQGLVAQVERAPDAQEFSVRLTNSGAAQVQTLTPQLQLGGGAGGGGRRIDLPALTLQPGTAPVGTPGRTDVRTALTPSPWRWLWLLPLLLLLGGLAWFLTRLRRQGGRRGRAPLPSVSGVDAPTIQGIEYRADRTLALVSESGEVSGISTPLGGPFDVGRQARVPLLSGLKAEHLRDGLKILNIPGDLEVSQGGRLIHAGDEVRPGTLLGVTVAKQARAPHAPLGSLVGLGLPLTLKPDGVTLHVQGPYGTHALTLQSGVTDLGDAFSAPALAGLKLSTSGPNILLADVPGGMTVKRSGEAAPLKPGTYLTGETVITLPSNE